MKTLSFSSDAHDTVAHIIITSSLKVKYTTGTGSTGVLQNYPRFDATDFVFRYDYLSFLFRKDVLPFLFCK